MKNRVTPAEKGRDPTLSEPGLKPCSRFLPLEIVESYLTLSGSAFLLREMKDDKYTKEVKKVKHNTVIKQVDCVA